MDTRSYQLYKSIVHSVTILMFGDSLSEANSTVHRIVDNALCNLGVEDAIESYTRDVIKDTVEDIVESHKDDEPEATNCISV